MLARRQGSVLLLVLAVVAALSYSVFSFSERMLQEYEATRASVDQIHMRTAAAAGIESARGGLEVPHDGPPDFPSEGHVADRDGRRLTYRLQGTISEDPQSAARGGLRNESARFNPNALSLKPSRIRESKERLLVLPGMTPDLASSLLGWMASPDPAPRRRSHDPDDIPRRRFERLDELLTVSGMTRQRLYGDDRNGNGLQDIDEPAANRSGGFSRGLSEFLTVIGRESSVSPTGVPKIDVNRKDLASLYDDLRTRLPDAAALFIVAARVAALEYDHEAPSRGPNPEDERLRRLDSARKRLERQLGTRAETDRGVKETSARDLTRAGLQLPTESPFRLESLAELAGAKIRVRIHDQDTLLTSPWRNDAQGFESLLRQLEPILTTVSGPGLEGRIHLQDAPLPVLRTVPRMTESLARTIVARRRPGSRDQQTIAWLLSEGLVTPAELRSFSAYLTTGGSVWRGVSIGVLEGNLNRAATQFVILQRGRTTDLLEQFDLPFHPAPPSAPATATASWQLLRSPAR